MHVHVHVRARNMRMSNYPNVCVLNSGNSTPNVHVLYVLAPPPYNKSIGPRLRNQGFEGLSPHMYRRPHMYRSPHIKVCVHMRTQQRGEWRATLSTERTALYLVRVRVTNTGSSG